eukprot:CAMPEP_0197079170 /NCGR_PEP_ID=MMETSP1384-20130603/213491_1 /TAXON_ID=29189 /ORGANISM="Ammonia sp." /LENGTH=293 /DNA_ID=CAMNT_0042518043 /DNA_START=90 /DNA_END=971 /DNA_ORIENTATION=-
MSFSLWNFLVKLVRLRRRREQKLHVQDDRNQIELQIQEIEDIDHDEMSPQTEIAEVQSDSEPPQSATTPTITADIKGNEDTSKIKEQSGRSPSSPRSYIETVIQSKYGVALQNKRLFLNLYVFMMTDFYVRCIPLLIFIASIPCQHDNSVCAYRVISGTALFSALLVFEYVANVRIRVISEYQSCRFVSVIFSVSVFSAFYTVLSTWSELKSDRFFGQSVDFRLFLVEHRIRIYVAIAINLINIALISVFAEKEEMAIQIGLFIATFVCVATNVCVLNVIKRDLDPASKHGTI